MISQGCVLTRILLQGDSGKGEKPTHTPRGSIDGLPGQSGQLPTPPPTPEQPKQLGSAISCLNIFPGSKGSASDGEFETIEASKASSLRHPAPLPPLKNIGVSSCMHTHCKMKTYFVSWPAPTSPFAHHSPALPLSSALPVNCVLAGSIVFHSWAAYLMDCWNDCGCCLQGIRAS